MTAWTRPLMATVIQNVAVKEAKKLVNQQGDRDRRCCCSCYMCENLLGKPIPNMKPECNIYQGLLQDYAYFHPFLGKALYTMLVDATQEHVTFGGCGKTCGQVAFLTPQTVTSANSPNLKTKSMGVGSHDSERQEDTLYYGIVPQRTRMHKGTLLRFATR